MDTPPQVFTKVHCADTPLEVITSPESEVKSALFRPVLPQQIQLAPEARSLLPNFIEVDSKMDSDSDSDSMMLSRLSSFAHNPTRPSIDAPIVSNVRPSHAYAVPDYNGDMTSDSGDDSDTKRLRVRKSDGLHDKPRYGERLYAMTPEVTTPEDGSEKPIRLRISKKDWLTRELAANPPTRVRNNLRKSYQVDSSDSGDGEFVPGGAQGTRGTGRLSRNGRNRDSDDSFDEDDWEVARGGSRQLSTSASRRPSQLRASYVKSAKDMYDFIESESESADDDSDEDFLSRGRKKSSKKKKNKLKKAVPDTGARYSGRVRARGAIYSNDEDDDHDDDFSDDGAGYDDDYGAQKRRRGRPSSYSLRNYSASELSLHEREEAIGSLFLPYLPTNEKRMFLPLWHRSKSLLKQLTEYLSSTAASTRDNTDPQGRSQQSSGSDPNSPSAHSAGTTIETDINGYITDEILMERLGWDVLGMKSIAASVVPTSSNAQSTQSTIVHVGENEVSTPVPVAPRTKRSLTPYQLLGLNWLVFLRKHSQNGVLADEMGLGKSVQAISLLNWIFVEGYLQWKKETGYVPPRLAASRSEQQSARSQSNAPRIQDLTQDVLEKTQGQEIVTEDATNASTLTPELQPVQQDLHTADKPLEQLVAPTEMDKASESAENKSNIEEEEVDLAAEAVEANYRYPKPFLLVTPASTVGNWQRELKHWTPHLRTCVYRGGGKGAWRMAMRKLQMEHEPSEDEGSEVDTKEEGSGSEEEEEVEEISDSEEEEESDSSDSEMSGSEMQTPIEFENDTDRVFDVIITTYTLFDRSSPSALIDRRILQSYKWELVVCDEGHYLKNAASQRFKNLCRIQANQRLILSGTPIQNSLDELFALLRFLQPQSFTPQIERLFTHRIKRAAQEEARLKAKAKERAKQLENEGLEAPNAEDVESALEDDGVDGGEVTFSIHNLVTQPKTQSISQQKSSLEASERRQARITRNLTSSVLHDLRHILQPFILRRSKAEVMKDLPEKTEQTILLDLPPFHRRVYDEVVRNTRLGSTHTLNLEDLVALMKGPLASKAPIDADEPVMSSLERRRQEQELQRIEKQKQKEEEKQRKLDEKEKAKKEKEDAKAAKALEREQKKNEKEKAKKEREEERLRKRLEKEQKKGKRSKSASSDKEKEKDEKSSPALIMKVPTSPASDPKEGDGGSFKNPFMAMMIPKKGSTSQEPALAQVKLPKKTKPATQAAVPGQSKNPNGDISPASKSSILHFFGSPTGSNPEPKTSKSEMVEQDVEAVEVLNSPVKSSGIETSPSEFERIDSKGKSVPPVKDERSKRMDVDDINAETGTEKKDDIELEGVAVSTSDKTKTSSPDALPSTLIVNPPGDALKSESSTSSPGLAASKSSDSPALGSIVPAGDPVPIPPSAESVDIDPRAAVASSASIEEFVATSAPSVQSTTSSPSSCEAERSSVVVMQVDDDEKSASATLSEPKIPISSKSKLMENVPRREFTTAEATTIFRALRNVTQHPLLIQKLFSHPDTIRRITQTLFDYEYFGTPGVGGCVIERAVEEVASWTDIDMIICLKEFMGWDWMQFRSNRESYEQNLQHSAASADGSDGVTDLTGPPTNKNETTDTVSTSQQHIQKLENPYSEVISPTNPKYGTPIQISRKARGFDVLKDALSQVPLSLFMASAKMKYLAEYLPKAIKSGHKILIFSQLLKILDILEINFHLWNIPYIRLDGSTDVQERQNLIDAFSSPTSQYKIFLLSTRAGGLGLNLVAADTVILHDCDWNPHSDAQAVDRVHRLGQTRPVTVQRLAATGTTDEYIMKIATAKIELDKQLKSDDHDSNKSGARGRGRGRGRGRAGRPNTTSLSHLLHSVLWGESVDSIDPEAISAALPDME